MKRTVWVWSLLGFAVTALGGTLLHFLYEWLGEAVWIAPFSGVNESTWEHMKLLFWPMLAYAAVQRPFFGGYRAFWCVKLRSALLGLSLIPILFYTLNGVIGKTPDWVNISIFFISAGVAYAYETRQLNAENPRCKSTRVALVALCVLALCFIIFTFRAPHLGIFRDPITGGYGI